MDQPSSNSDLQTDHEFDAYWEEEARNPHRNRIRIGRQYQATIPPRLKSGEGDGRKLDNLETITWRRENGLTDDKLNDYFVTSRALGLMGRYRVGKVTEPSAGSSMSSALPTTTDKNNPHHNNNNNNNNNNANSTNKNGIYPEADLNDKSTNNTKTSPSTKTKTLSSPPIIVATKNLSFESEMISLCNFVSSHHPANNDDACTVKKPDAKSESWSMKEARMFAHALETYGKNFGAIKKSMPWKPAKSIIDHYYKKSGGGGGASDDGSDDQDGNGGGGGGQNDGSKNNNENTSLSTTNESSSNVNSKSTSTSTSTTNASSSTPKSQSSINNSTFLPSLHARLLNDRLTTNNGHHQSQKSESSPGNLKPLGSHPKFLIPFFVNGNSTPNAPTASHPTDSDDGAEIKPVKAKPIFKNDPVETSLTNGEGQSTSVLGSLKFFMDGQLVLKLNATPADSSESSPTEKIVPATTNPTGNRCHWVESPDTKILKTHPRTKKYRRTIRTERSLDSVGSKNTESSSTGSSGRASVVSCEDSEDLSSDDDDRESLESAESRSLPSPSPASTNATPRKGLASRGVTKVVDSLHVRSPSNVPSPSSSGKDVKRDFSVYAFEDEPVVKANSAPVGGLSGLRKRPKQPSSSAIVRSEQGIVFPATRSGSFQHPSNFPAVRGGILPSSDVNLQSSALDLSSKSGWKPTSPNL